MHRGNEVSQRLQQKRAQRQQTAELFKEAIRRDIQQGNVTQDASIKIRHYANAVAKYSALFEKYQAYTNSADEKQFVECRKVLVKLYVERHEFKQAYLLIVQWGVAAEQHVPAEHFAAIGYFLFKSDDEDLSEAGQAVRFMEIAIEKIINKNPIDKTTLAKIYEQLVKIFFSKKQYQKCYDVYCEAAKNGIHDFYYMLAEFVSDKSYKIKAKPKESEFYWRELAYQHNNPDGQYNYACMFLNGDGVEKNYVRAAELFKPLAVQGDVRACINLGSIYQTGGSGVERDLAIAEMHLKNAVAHGENDALCHLAINYFLQQDVARAYKLFSDLAEDNMVAQYGLGLICEVHNQDIAAAITWYMQAASQGHFGALVNLTLLLLQKLDSDSSLRQEHRLYQTTVSLLKKVAQQHQKPFLRSIADDFEQRMVTKLEIDRLNGLSARDISVNVSRIHQTAEHELLAPTVKLQIIVDIVTNNASITALASAAAALVQILRDNTDQQLLVLHSDDLQQLLIRIDRSLDFAVKRKIPTDSFSLMQLFFNLSRAQLHPKHQTMQCIVKKLVTELITAALPLTQRLAVFYACSRFEPTEGIAAVVDDALPMLMTELPNFNIRQLTNFAYALAVMDANGQSYPEGKIVLAQLETILMQTKIILNDIELSQAYLAAVYFDDITLVPRLSPQHDALLKRQIALNKSAMSQLQRQVMNGFKQVFAAVDVSEEVAVAGLCVDGVVKGVIVQVDGPTHFAHAPGQQPVATTTENFHNALLAKAGKNVIHVRYDEIDASQSLGKLLRQKCEAVDLTWPITRSHHSALQWWSDQKGQQTTVNDARKTTLSGPDKCDDSGFDKGHGSP